MKKRWPFILMLSLIAISVEIAHAQADKEKAYKNFSQRVIGRVIALKDRHPQLRNIATQGTTLQSPQGFWIQFNYDNAVQMAPNPAFAKDPTQNPQIKTFSDKNGISLNLNFYEGPWRGSAMVAPVQIEDLNMLISVSGNSDKATSRIKKDIVKIMNEEKVTLLKELGKEEIQPK